MAGFDRIGEFGDKRLAARGAWMCERMVAAGSVVARRLGQGRAGEVAIHRFLGSPAVTVEEIVAAAAARTAASCVGRRIVAVQDTTDINFRGRDRGRRGLGPGSDGVGLGFFIHPVIAVDAEDEAVVGLLDATIWTRPADQPGKRCAERRRRPLAEKESQRWLDGARAAAKRAGAARQVIVVGDRESDVYGLFAQRPGGVDLIVRAAQDRALGDGGRLFEQAAGWPSLGVQPVKVAPRGPGDRGRVAAVALRAATVRIKRPRHGADPSDAPALDLNLVEAREVTPGVAKPLHWRLLTTLPVGDLAAVEEVVRLYRLRWRIEQTFRGLKSDGLKLEDTQVEDRDRLFKLTAIALVAAVRTIQLVDGRDGGNRPASEVLDPALFAAAAAIGKRLEGKTARQRNPHAPGSLGWLAWIVARLGGWNCYYKPPGPKTMRHGWDRFDAMLAGYQLARPLS